MIVPLFALANAGIHLTGGLLSDAVSSPITIGIVVAYVVGKPFGIFMAPWIATMTGWGSCCFRLVPASRIHTFVPCPILPKRNDSFRRTSI